MGLELWVAFLAGVATGYLVPVARKAGRKHGLKRRGRL